MEVKDQDIHMPRVSNRDANGNLTCDPQCAFASISTRSTESRALLSNMAKTYNISKQFVKKNCKKNFWTLKKWI